MLRNADPKQFDIQWMDSGREPRVKPNPNYPNGIDLGSVPPDKTGCKIELPYPAKRIGSYVIYCKLCGLRAAITTAGRPDDPRSVSIVCKRVG